MPIDLLRALAIFLVLGAHLQIRPPETSPLFHSLIGIWHRGGWMGVDLFFVLSGFLVSGLLFREHEKFGKIMPWRFLVRRGFKIYPGFWVLIGTTVAVASLRHDPLHPHTVLSELLFVQNYRSALWPHTWSLAVEEHFYFLLVLFLVLLSFRKSPKPFSAVPVAFIVVAVMCLLFRLMMAVNPVVPGNGSVTTHIYPTHLRMDSLFFGVLLSYFYHVHDRQFLEKIQRWRAPLFLCGLLCLAPAFIFRIEYTPFIYTWGFTLLYLGSGALLCALLTMKLPQTWPLRSIAYIGSHSYSIYLWHFAVLFWIVPLAALFIPAKTNWFCYLVVYIVGAVGLGIPMALLIEFPMLRLRDKLFPSRSRPLSTSSRSTSDVTTTTPVSLSQN